MERKNMAIMRYTACPFYSVPETAAVTVCTGGRTLHCTSTGRCRRLTKSSPTLAVSRCSSYCVQFSSYLLQNVL